MSGNGSNVSEAAAVCIDVEVRAKSMDSMPAAEASVMCLALSCVGYDRPVLHELKGPKKRPSSLKSNESRVLMVSSVV